MKNARYLSCGLIAVTVGLIAYHAFYSHAQTTPPTPRYETYEPGNLDPDALRNRARHLEQVVAGLKDQQLQQRMRSAHGDARKAWDARDLKRAGQILSFMEAQLREAGALAPTQNAAQQTPERLTPGWKEIGPEDFKVRSNLSAAVVKVDISPPVGTVARGHTRVTTGIRDPLTAGVTIFDDGKTRAVIVTLDLPGCLYPEVAAIRAAVSEVTKAPEQNILVAASHNHSGPRLEPETSYGKNTIDAIKGAASVAVRKLRPVTLGYAEDRISFDINRRLPRPGGGIGGPDPDGAADHRVRVLSLDDGTPLTPLATLMHAVCHPTCFTKEYPNLSSDYPGEAQRFVERAFEGQTGAVFLQGYSGNVRPRILGENGNFTGGTELETRWAGMDLGAAVVRAAAKTLIREERRKRKQQYSIRSATKTILLPARRDLGDERPHDPSNYVVKDGKVQIRCDLQALRIGEFLFLAMPGEPFVEYGWHLEKAIGNRALVIPVGYANGYIGYLCTKEAYEAGGYEPSASLIWSDGVDTLLKAVLELAGEVLVE